jgi:carbamoyl-phosphate synthase large subunit
MVVGAGEFQVPIIKQCKESGHKVIATDMNPNADGFKYSDVVLNIDTLDKQKTLQEATKYNIDAILTTSDYPVRTVAYVCESLNLKGLSSKSSEICTNKQLLRDCMKLKNIKTPQYWTHINYDNFEKVLNIEDLPVIIKPVDSSASRGVSIVNKIWKFKKAFDEAIKYSKSGEVIIEEYIDGQEYSIEALTQNGKTVIVAITEKTTTGYPYFIEERHIIPANINTNPKNIIIESVLNVIKAIGLDNCASHTEIRLSSSGPIVIEIGARLGGDFITSDLVPLSTGVNMLDNVIRIALGEDICVKNDITKYSGIQFLTPSNYEKIKKHLHELSSMKQVTKIKVYDNNQSISFKSSLDRLGYYISVCDTRQELLEILNIYN